MEELQYKDWEQQRCSKNGSSISDEASFRCGGIRRTGLLSKWDCSIPAMFFCEKAANAVRVNNLPETTPHGGSTTATEQTTPTTATPTAQPEDKEGISR